MTTDERIEQAVERVAALLRDGLQLADIGALIREAVEVAEAIGEAERLAGPDKHAVAVALVDRFLVLAEPQADALVAIIVDSTDGPGPDAIIDPIVKRFATPLVVGLVRKLSPSMIDLVCAASAGRVAVNVTKETA